VALGEAAAATVDATGAEAEPAGGVATDVAVAEEVLEEIEDALAAGELTVEEADAVEEVVVEAAEAELAHLPQDEVTEEGRGDA
jgi:hypothetical protein